MRGKAHWKIGICTCAIGGTAISAIYYAMSGTRYEISYMSALSYAASAAIGGLFPDIDKGVSMLGKKFNKVAVAISLVSILLLMLLAITVGLELTSSIANQAMIKNPISLAVFIIMIVLTVKYFFKRNGISVAAKTIRYGYTCIALCIIVVNLIDLKMIFVALTIAIIPYHKHREFTHTLEGMICYCLAFTLAAQKLGQPYLGLAFFMGYFSHIWMADFLTTQGIYISFLVKKFGEKFVVVKKLPLYKFLTSKKSLNLVKMSTDSGNKFEFIYTLAFIVLAIILLFICASYSVDFT